MPDEARVAVFWQLWSDADRLKGEGRFGAAREALERADALGGELGWSRQTAPLWIVESELLRGAMLHDEGDTAAGYEMLQSALLGWRLVGAALIGTPPSAEFREAVHRGALERRVALEGEAVVAARAARAGVTQPAFATGTFLLERFIPAMAEAAARAIALTAVVASYSQARSLVNELLGATRDWTPAWDPVKFEIGLRMALAGAATRSRRLEAALGQDEDALALARRLPHGPYREKTEAELHANRAGAFLALGRHEEAIRDFEHAERWMRGAGNAADAARMRIGVLRSRADAGERVDPASLRALILEMEGLMDAVPQRRGALVEDLEWLRRWYLAELAEVGTDDLEEVIALFESLRGDRSVMRAAVDHDDAVVARLARPFTVLGSRLMALERTAVLAVEPGMGPSPETAHPPTILTLWTGGPGGLHWHLAKGHESLAPAVAALTSAAAREGGRLNTRELPLRQPASATLTDAAAEAWRLLPEPTRQALLAADTVLWLPSARIGFDAFPVELLRHDHGWLGLTHVVARSPSFQYLEEMLAPNRRRYTPSARATVVQVAQSDELGGLTEAAADADVAMRAGAVLGLEPELRHVATTDDLKGVFADAALVHYVGHGFASELGEWLPVSPVAGVTPDEIAWSADQPAPVVFFNACLLGRVRQVAGARHRGWAVSLLAHGAPAVIGALIPVPDSACATVAAAFYRGAWKAPLGEALRSARRRLEDDGFHPLIAGAYVLHGDPNATFSGASSAGLTRRWPAELTRLLATRAAAHREALVAGAPPALQAWARGEQPAPIGAEHLLDADPEGAGALRIALAVEHVERADSAEAAQAELSAAYLCGSALDDTYAEAFLLARYRAHWLAIHPEERDSVEGSLEYKLAQLGDDRALIVAAAAASRSPDDGERTC